MEGLGGSGGLSMNWFKKSIASSRRGLGGRKRRIERPHQHVLQRSEPFSDSPVNNARVPPRREEPVCAFLLTTLCCSSFFHGSCTQCGGEEWTVSETAPRVPNASPGQKAEAPQQEPCLLSNAFVVLAANTKRGQ